MKVLIVSAVDISIPNGQGIYSRELMRSTLASLSEISSNVNIITASVYPARKIDFEIEHFFSSKKKRNILWALTFQFELLRLLFHCRPDYIVLSVKPSLFSISILKSFLDYKLVCFVEGDSSKNLFSFLNPTVAKISLFLLEMLIKSADSVFPAYYSAKEWVDRVRSDSKSIIVPVGIDQAVFNDEFASKPNIFNKESFIIGYVGSFRLVHRVDLLIEVLNHDERIKLCLVGDGECFDDIKESVKFLGLADRVEFKGAVDHSYVPEIVSKCDILWGYTDPLHWGVPIKVFEYLALNRPVIASKRREFDFIQKYNFGLTTKSINSREIYDELMCYLSNIKTINSREYILKNYRWDSLGERVRSIVAK